MPHTMACSGAMEVKATDKQLTISNEINENALTEGKCWGYRMLIHTGGQVVLIEELFFLTSFIMANHVIFNAINSLRKA